MSVSVVLFALLVSFAVPRNPIVLIPGFMGSKIDGELHDFEYENDAWWCPVNKDTFRAWLSLDLFVEPEAECFQQFFSLRWDGDHASNPKGFVSHHELGLDGVRDLIPVFSDWSTALSYYGDMIDALKALGYVENVDLVAAPFDFRYSPRGLANDYYIELKEKIEMLVKNTGKKVTVVAHSQGAPTFQNFIQQFVTQEWLDENIEISIPIAPAYGGAFNAIEATIIGYNIGDILVNKTTIREMVWRWPGIYFLYPNSKTWYDPVVLARGSGKLYYPVFNDYVEMLMDSGNPEDAVEILRSVQKHSYEFTRPTIKTHIIYGHGVETNCRIEFSGNVAGDGDYEFIKCDGDGTVIARTVERVCDMWVSDSLVTCETVSDKGHVEIIAEKSVIDRVVEIASSY